MIAMKRINIKHLFVALVLILAMVLSTGCDLLPGVDTSPPSSSPATENITPIDSEWSITPAENEAPILPGIADVVAKVKPSVVAISIEITDR